MFLWGNFSNSKRSTFKTFLISSNSGGSFESKDFVGSDFPGVFWNIVELISKQKFTKFSKVNFVFQKIFVLIIPDFIRKRYGQKSENVIDKNQKKNHKTNTKSRANFDDLVGCLFGVF